MRDGVKLGNAELVVVFIPNPNPVLCCGAPNDGAPKVPVVNPGVPNVLVDVPKFRLGALPPDPNENPVLLGAPK